jgi:hypothetical protein
MALIRCPGCKNDTSDSLANCPNCGAALHGSGPSLFDRGREARFAASASTITQAMGGEAPPPAATTLDPGSIVARAAGLGVKLKAAALVAGLLVLAFVPHAVPLLIVAAVFWALWNRRRTDSQQRSGDVEALRILVNEVRRPRSQSSTDRPLTRLRKLEEQLRSRPRA